MKILPRVAVLILTSLGVGVASWQRLTARTEHQPDLFDRRYVVFSAAQAFLADIIAHTDASESALRAFDLGTADAALFYGDEVITYLTGLRRASRDLQGVLNTLPAQVGGDQRCDGDAANSVRAQWTRAQFELLIATFGPYLRLTDRSEGARSRSPKFRLWKARSPSNML